MSLLWKSWIVTLDVLKFYWDAGRKNAYLLNSNIRCIEMKGVLLEMDKEIELNSNIRCIEICVKPNLGK